MSAEAEWERLALARLGLASKDEIPAMLERDTALALQETEMDRRGKRAVANMREAERLLRLYGKGPR